MSAPGQNKASLLRFVDMVWNRGALEFVDELIAADYVGHHPPGATPVLGPAGVQRRVAECREAMPDLYVKIDGLIAEEDRVAIIWRAAGVCRGDTGAGPPRSPVRYEGLSVVRLLAGKQVESQTIWRHHASSRLPHPPRVRTSTAEPKPDRGGHVWDSE